MINIPPIKPRTDIKTEILGDVSKTWKVGQVLNGTVTRGGELQDIIQFRIGQHLFESRTPLPLQTGDQIQLMVRQLGIEPLLNILSPITSREAAIQQLRHYINNQLDFKPLLQTIQNILETDSADGDIKSRLQKLLDIMPDPQQATDASQLKKLIQDSGIFLEHRLLSVKTTDQSKQILQQELKTQLLALKQILTEELPASTSTHGKKNEGLESIISQYLKGEINLKQLTQLLGNRLPADKLQQLGHLLQQDDDLAILRKEPLLSTLQQLVMHIKAQPNAKNLLDTLILLLLKQPMLQNLKSQIDSLLNKITTQQLLPLTADTETPRFLLFDLPVKHNGETDIFQFRIDHEKPRSRDEKTGWTVSINFTMEELGAIQTKIHLHDNTISTLFHAERRSTADTIRQHLPILESAFRKAGFSIKNIDVVEQRLHQARNLPRDIHFLDEKA